MKQLEILLLIIGIWCVAVVCNAQDVNGLEIGKEYTKAQVIDKLGQPDRFEIDNSYDGNGMKFTYGNNIFYFYNWGEGAIFADFSIYTEQFVTMSQFVQGGIKIGDDVSKIKLLGLKIEKSGTYAYKIWFEDWAYMTFGYNDSKITHIGCTVLD